MDFEVEKEKAALKGAKIFLSISEEELAKRLKISNVFLSRCMSYGMNEHAKEKFINWILFQFGANAPAMLTKFIELGLDGTKTLIH